MSENINPPQLGFLTSTGVAAISASNSTFTGTVRITGGPNITVGTDASGASISGAAQTVQPVGSLGVSSNTTGTTASLPFASNIMLQGGANITLSQSSGTNSSIINISGPASVADTGSVVALSNTTGTTASIPLSKPFGLAGGANITLSQSSGTNSTNLTIIGGAGAGGGVAISASNTLYTSGTATITGSNMITVKSSAAQGIVIDATQSAAPVGSIAATGNTTGTMATLPLSSSVGLSAGNNVTISQSSGATSTNFVFSVPNTTRETNYNAAHWDNMDPSDVTLVSHASAFSKTPFYYPAIFPGNVTLNSVAIRVSHVNTSTLQSFSVHLGVYTRVNSTSAALVGSASDAFVYSTASSVSFSGMRDIVLTSPSTQAAISTLSAGAYIIGLMFSVAATGSMNWSLAGMTQSTQGIPFGYIPPGTNTFATATSQGVNVFLGQGSTTVGAMPANVVQSDLRNQGTATTPIIPFLMIRS